MKKNNKEVSQRKQKRHKKNTRRLSDKTTLSKFERQQEFIKQALMRGVFNKFAKEQADEQK
jgi:hypothetical protein